jgi:hypothetical protein
MFNRTGQGHITPDSSQCDDCDGISFLKIYLCLKQVRRLPHSGQKSPKTSVFIFYMAP